MAIPIRSSPEIQIIINNAQQSLGDLGLDVVNEKKQGVTISNTSHRDKIYKILLLRAYLQTILTPTGGIISYFSASDNENKFNKILDGLVSLSQGFSGPAIPLLGTKNIPLIIYSTSGGGGGSSPSSDPFITQISNTDVDIGTEIIDSFSAAITEVAVWYVTVKGSGGGEGTRGSMIVASWRAGSADFYEAPTTPDIGGSTSALTFTVTLTAGVVYLNAVATSDNWSIKGLRIKSTT